MTGTDKDAPGQQSSGDRDSGLFVDAEGDWYHDGAMIFRDNIISLFLENLSVSPSGTYQVRCNQEPYDLKAADTPFVVSRVDRISSETAPEKEEKILLRFKHLTIAEPLDPSTLRVGRENILYCTVRNGRFPARFSRPAYYQLAQWIEEDHDTGRFCLTLNGIRHFITGAPIEA